MNERTQSVAQEPTTSGRMTATMRAVSPGGPKALRLGLVRDGRVVEERVFKAREPVTVGANERNSFVVTTQGLPSKYRLFDVEGGAYVLQFNDTMTGKVALPSGVTELSELQRNAERGDGVYRLVLDEGVRGKVVVGDCTFLFQFVSPPPVQPKPQLPASVTRGAVDIDWTTTMIAAFSFLAHFMAIGAIYSDWLDPVVNYDITAANLVESVKNLPTPPEVEQQNVEEVTETEQADKPAEEKREVAKKKAEIQEPGQKKPMSASEAAALAEELDSFDMGILGANIGLTATSDVLSDSESIATSVMDQAAASGAGVSAGGPGGLKLNAAGGALSPGETGNSLASIGATGKTSGGGSGQSKVVKGPTGSAAVGGAAVAGGKVSNASRVVARMRAGFRACYNRGLATNPDAAGRISLRLKIGPGGEVAGVTASSSGNLPASVVSCVKARARSGRFSPPEGGAAVVSVPVTFVKQ